MTADVIVVCGNAGTGKSTWGRRLATTLGATFLDIDTTSERLVEAAQRELGRDPRDRDSPDYKRVYREAIHETLFALARDNPGRVVIVAPFTIERRRADFPAWLAERLGRPAVVHYFVTREDVRRARLVARDHPRDANKLVDFASYASVGRETERPPYPHEWFDTTDGFPEK